LSEGSSSVASVLANVWEEVPYWGARPQSPVILLAALLRGVYLTKEERLVVCNYLFEVIVDERITSSILGLVSDT
jgi:hypothetical protein